MKFAQTPSHAATETCKSCITSLAPLLPVREMGDASSITSIPDSQIPASYDDSQSLSQPTSLAIHQTIIPDSQPLAPSQESQALYYAAQPEQSNTSQSAVVRSNTGGSLSMTKETDKLISIPDIAKVGGHLSVALL